MTFYSFFIWVIFIVWSLFGLAVASFFLIHHAPRIYRDFKRYFEGS